MSFDIASLSPEYVRLFNTCQPRDTAAVEKIAARFPSVASYYDAASVLTGVPVYVIFLLHHMECDLSFSLHLHNGDSLRRKTVNDPAGRPPVWEPSEPPTHEDWSRSAVDALRYDRLDQINPWDVAGIAYGLEKFNGWGYRSHGINDPYLWSGSNHYERGKYVSDGHFDPDAVSSQVGAMVVLAALCKSDLVALPAIAIP